MGVLPCGIIYFTVSFWRAELCSGVPLLFWTSLIHLQLVFNLLSLVQRIFYTKNNFVLQRWKTFETISNSMWITRFIHTDSFLGATEIAWSAIFQSFFSWPLEISTHACAYDFLTRTEGDYACFSEPSLCISFCPWWYLDIRDSWNYSLIFCSARLVDSGLMLSELNSRNCPSVSCWNCRAHQICSLLFKNQCCADF